MALLERLKNFLLELGKGFAFVGNQVRLEVGGKDDLKRNKGYFSCSFGAITIT